MFIAGFKYIFKPMIIVTRYPRNVSIFSNVSFLSKWYRKLNIKRRERIYTKTESFPMSMKIGMRYKKFVRVENPRLGEVLFLFMLFIVKMRSC